MENFLPGQMDNCHAPTLYIKKTRYGKYIVSGLIQKFLASNVERVKCPSCDYLTQKPEDFAEFNQHYWVDGSTSLILDLGIFLIVGGNIPKCVIHKHVFTSFRQ